MSNTTILSDGTFFSAPVHSLKLNSGNDGMSRRLERNLVACGGGNIVLRHVNSWLGNESLLVTFQILKTRRNNSERLWALICLVLSH